MSREQTETMRRRKDGSIDSDHYIAKGMRARSLEAHRALDFLLTLARRIVADTEGPRAAPARTRPPRRRSRDRLSAVPAASAASGLR